jgi:hypothetical protein
MHGTVLAFASTEIVLTVLNQLYTLNKLHHVLDGALQ